MKPSLLRQLSFGCGALAALLPSLPARADLLPASALAGKKVLFVAGEADADHPNDDKAAKAHLAALGLVVTEAGDSDSDAKAAGQDLVVISASADAHALQAAYRASPVPVLTWNAMSYPNLGMTGPRRHVDFEEVSILHYFAQSYTDLYGYCVNPTHPIAKAVGLGAQMFGTLYLEPQDTNWGDPGPAGQVVAVFEGNLHKAAIFGYERGATMCQGVVAPARRVGFFLGPNNFHQLTSAGGPSLRDPKQATWYVGLALFDACVRWALTPPDAPPASDPAALHAALAKAAQGKKVLFVERVRSPEGAEADEHNVAYLKALGFDVTIADQEDPDSRAAGMDFVVIAATCSKYKLTGKYGDCQAPLMCHEGLYADVIKMAGLNRYTDFGEHGEDKESDDPEENYLDIVDASHPLAAGFPAGTLAFTKEPGTLKWAVPPRSAQIVATLPNAPEQAAIFGFEKGALMTDGYIAPARRLLFPLDNPAFDDLTPSGLALYDASVLWCISQPR